MIYLEVFLWTLAQVKMIIIALGTSSSASYHIAHSPEALIHDFPALKLAISDYARDSWVEIDL